MTSIEGPQFTAHLTPERMNEAASTPRPYELTREERKHLMRCMECLDAFNELAEKSQAAPQSSE